MRELIGGVAAAAAIAFAPVPLAPTPATTIQGDPCQVWHATTQDVAGQTLYCVRTSDGKNMYWMPHLTDGN
jgi:hypothetical protein